jgi:hypothetical protein
MLEVYTDSFVGEEDTILWLLKGDLKAETESEIVVAKDQALQTMQQKYCKHKQTANADCANNLMRHTTTLYQHVQYWQNNNTYRDMTACVPNYTSTRESRGKMRQ